MHQHTVAKYWKLWYELVPKEVNNVGTVNTQSCSKSETKKCHPMSSFKRWFTTKVLFTHSLDLNPNRKNAIQCLVFLAWRQFADFLTTNWRQFCAWVGTHQKTFEWPTVALPNDITKFGRHVTTVMQRPAKEGLPAKLRDARRSQEK